MTESWHIRPMQSGEEPAVCELVIRVFNDFVAQHYSPQGIAEFLKYVQPDLLRHRSQSNHFVLVATTTDEFVGMIEMRNHRHVSLLFVDKRFQGRGMSRNLLDKASAICHEHEPDLHAVTVHSSPNAVHIYEKLGFRQTESEQTVNGIRFIPMKLEPWVGCRRDQR
ncbi:GNAT family N-acetyltransferase [candidate division KSB1 bacterium]|nr:GNAT family N-acetyltransferase [candidate division KSB1 bacterium]NIT72435.1 GNAT family N-acetyltransferase [candidate division KSB1 bacterium]NIX72115.1 GNAT family N-acetyltransferase [candidate division KSB1 bacterium]